MPNPYRKRSIIAESSLPPIKEVTIQSARTAASRTTPSPGTMTSRSPDSTVAKRGVKRPPFSPTRKANKANESDESREPGLDQAGSTVRRTSFGSVGTKMTTLIKAKNSWTALRNNRRQSRDEPVIEAEVVPVFEIKEMPKEPRFASMLSPEAQYAIMKGYEDVVYGNICTQFPEYGPLIKRNKTPITGIKMTDKDEPQSPRGQDTGPPQSANDVLQSSPRLLQNRASKTFNFGDIPTISSPTSPEGDANVPDGRRSPRHDEYITISDLGSPDGHVGGSTMNLAHGNTLFPRIYELEKQQKLVMTYRYQSAMDILDKLRQQQGIHKLSPRDTTVAVQTQPVRDFNHWVHVWGHEFEPKPNEFRKVDEIRNR